MAIRAAAGYPQYSPSLIHPMWSNRLVDELYCMGCWAEISTTDYIGELMNCGDSVTFYRAPRPKGRRYVKDQKLEANTLSLEPVTLEITEAWYNDYKIDRIDEWQICNYEGIEAALVKGFAADLSNEMTKFLFDKMIAGADADNKGRTAGKMSHVYDLGATGNPVSVDNQNITSILARFHGVLDEQCLEQEGRYLILPYVARPILLSSELKQAYLTGQSISPLLNGRLPSEIYGFNIYFCADVPVVRDVTANAQVSYVFAGVRRATAMAEQLNEFRITSPHDAFERRVQQLSVYGGGVVEPRGIAIGYFRFQ